MGPQPHLPIVPGVCVRNMRVMPIPKATINLGLGLVQTVFLWIGLVLAFNCTFVCAQVPYPELIQYKHRIWRVEDGLPQNSILTILQSRDGYLWLGTQVGLVRFDGVHFHVYTKNDTPGMIGHHILSLFEDASGQLWFGTFDGGLHSFRQGRAQSYLSDNVLPANIIRCFYQDKDGALLIGTEAKGLWKFDQGSFSQLELPPDSAQISIRAMIRDSAGWLWLGTEGDGILRINTDMIEHYSRSNGLTDDNIYSFCEDRNKTMWIGTGKGLLVYQNGVFQKPGEIPRLPDDLVRTIYEDTSGGIWIGTRANGLFRIVDGVVYCATFNDPEIPMLTIIEDRESSFWLGTIGGGLYQLSQRDVVVYTKKHGLNDDIVWAIAADHSGRIWLGTSSGLTFYEQGVFDRYDAISQNMIWALYPSEESGLWLGVRGEGVIQLDPSGQLTQFKHGLVDVSIWAIQEDEHGDIWASSAGGLSLIHDGLITNYTIEDGLPSNRVFSLLADADNVLWLGTQEGLCKMRAGQIEVFTKENGLTSNVVVSLYKDNDGILWIGTYGGGLNRLKEGTFCGFTKQDGLFDDSVFQIIEDNAAHLWLSSNKGIFRISKQELDEFERSKSTSLTCQSFGLSDGMLSPECNGGCQPAGIYGPDRRIWFPTMKGVAVIDPDHLIMNKVKPLIFLEQVLANESRVDHHCLNEYGPGRGDLEFHYSASSFVVPEKVRFQYKLEGFDKNWIEAGTRRVAYYTNIPPGRYQFMVKACNNDGVWTDQALSYDFTLKPFYYQTLIFRVFLITAVLAIVSVLLYFSYRVRLRVVRAEAAVLAERNKLAQEIHDTIAQGLQGLIIVLQIIQNKISKAPSEISTEIDKAYKLARETLQEARYSVSCHEGNSRHEGNFPKFLQSKIEPLFTESPIKFEFEVKGQPFLLSPMKEFYTMRIAQEAARNALKHASPTRITISLNYDHPSLHLTISDDGHGFIHNAPAITEDSGFGLVGMAERAKQIGAHFNISSFGDSGTVVELILNINRQ
ncbi:hypothetical protein JXQ70_06795 [bacterium]|nr:hypothetical protein [bacterium]